MKYPRVSSLSDSCRLMARRIDIPSDAIRAILAPTTWHLCFRNLSVEAIQQQIKRHIAITLIGR